MSLPIVTVSKSLLLACLALRAFIPLGYMPGNALAGEVAALCPSGSAATYAVLQTLSPQHHHHDNHHGHLRDGGVSVEQTCPIGSALSTAVLPPSAHTLTDPAPVAGIAPILADGGYPTRPSRAPRSRGPPHT